MKSLFSRDNRVFLGMAQDLLVLMIAGVHIYLWWHYGYRFIPKVGIGFILASIFGVVAVIAHSIFRFRVFHLIFTAFALCLLGGYGLALYLPQGIFGFIEPGISKFGMAAIISESILAVLSLAAVAKNSGRKNLK